MDSYLEALEALIALIFLLNLEYPKTNAKFLSFIGSNICKIEQPLSKYKSIIASVLNKIL